MIPRYLKEAEKHSATVLAEGMKKVLANTTGISSQVFEYNREEDGAETEKDTIEEGGDEIIDVSTLLIID